MGEGCAIKRFDQDDSGEDFQQPLFKPGTKSMPTKSQVLFAKARRLMPGGVNSPVRAFRAVGGDPIFMASGKGANDD